MIKWSEFREGSIIFEAFLPEHEFDPHDWLLRASCAGHIIEERRVRLVWPPRFGPDAGDVAAIEAELDSAVARIVAPSPPRAPGSYEPGACETVGPDPYVHAVLHWLLGEYVEAEAFLGFTPEQTATNLGLPLGHRADRLYPMAITPRRDARMRRITALARLAAGDQRVSPRVSEIVDAVVRDDIPAIRRALEESGVNLVDPPS